MINWIDPLEAYHPDGRVIPVVFNQHDGYCYNIVPHQELDGGRNWSFDPDGTHPASDWRIRNVAEQSEDLVDLLKTLRDVLTDDTKFLTWDEEKAIIDKIDKHLAVMEPVDLDLMLARACLDAAENAEDAVLMAIKSVRSKQPTIARQLSEDELIEGAKEAVDVMERLKADIPDYVGDDPRALHYQKLHRGLNTALSILRCYSL